MLLDSLLPQPLIATISMMSKNAMRRNADARLSDALRVFIEASPGAPGVPSPL